MSNESSLLIALNSKNLPIKDLHGRVVMFKQNNNTVKNILKNEFGYTQFQLLQYNEWKSATQGKLLLLRIALNQNGLSLARGRKESYTQIQQLPIDSVVNPGQSTEELHQVHIPLE